MKINEGLNEGAVMDDEWIMRYNEGAVRMKRGRGVKNNERVRGCYRSEES